MKLRTVLFFSACLFLFITLSSCHGEDQKENIQIAFSQCISNHPWRDAMNRSMQLEASLHPNVDLTIYEADTNADQQIKDVEKMIADSVDVIIISPLEPNRIVPTLEKAFFLGIPVILIDRKINSNNYTAYIGADNIEIGRNAGKYIASIADQPVNVIELKGGDDSSPVLERSVGFHQVIDPLPHIKVIKTIEGDENGVPYELYENALDSLRGTKIHYAFAFSDEMAKQAIDIAWRKGIVDIKYVGVDGLPGPDGGVEMVKDGKLEATILYPTGGIEVIKLALRVLDGEDISKQHKLTTTIIDKFNADIMKTQFDKINEHQAQIENQIAAIDTMEAQYQSQNNLLRATIVLLIVIFSLAAYSIYLIVRIRNQNRQLKANNQEIRSQRNEIEKIASQVKESNEAKIGFFMGLSHEFKTPITLIQSSIESIKEVAGKRLSHETELIYNNSRRLLRLLNNLLDFRRIEGKMFNLKASKTNIYTFSKNIFKDFEREAKKRNIQFELKCENKDLLLYIDRNLMDKVYFNLLSNAFKFTPDNGTIQLNIIDNTPKNYASIEFKDTGIGIPKEEIQFVFQPFFKGSNNRKNSSGLGLNLSKELVELHKGTIEVRSIQGTEFKIVLFKGKLHLEEDEIIEEADLIDANLLDFDSSHPDESFLLENVDNPDGEKPSILIVEDNADLLKFLEIKLRTSYEVFACNGTNVLDMAFETIPDIILCDVNLPDKNGFELCGELKNDLRTSHIPVVLLTAMDSKDSYLKGLESGADLYLTKPFSFSILAQSMKALLYNREKLRFYYVNNIYRIEPTGSHKNLEHSFIGKLNQVIKQNIDNTDFSVEQLATELDISRVQLYRKLKAIMGINVRDYIGNYRLEEARHMLETTPLSVTEVAYANGFSSPSYFSTVFKNKFDTSPGSYRKSTRR